MPGLSEFDVGMAVGAVVVGTGPVSFADVVAVAGLLWRRPLYELRLAAVELLVDRVTVLEVGDLAVVVATTAGHRGSSFEATRALIDTLKAEVPIWKHQLFSDGTDEWVGAP